MKRTGKVYSIAVVILFLIAVTRAFAQAPVKDDAYITSASAGSNFGGNASLVVQTGTASGSNICNLGSCSYIRFDLSRLPSGLTKDLVSKATVKLYLTAVTASGSFDVIEVGGTSQNWSESTLTYSAQPSSVVQVLQTGISVPSTSSKYQYIEVDITAAVKDWLSGTVYNNGIVIRPSSGSSISATFSSKEDSTYSHDPELNIVFSQAASQIVGTIAPSQIGPGTANINISGNAATATLATGLSNPLPGQCPMGQFAGGITNTGNVASCGAPSATSLSGVVPITSGGTGATTAPGALLNLGGLTSSALATKADITAPVKVDQTAQANGACATANAVVLNPTQPAGQQVFVCHQNQDQSLTWISVNDETSLQQQIAALTTNSATAAAALNAEIQRAEAAEATLTTNLNKEVTRATGAEQTLTTNLNAEVTRATTAESANLATAKSYTDISVSAETNRAQAAESSLSNGIGSVTSSLTSEVARATTAEAGLQTGFTNGLATKADINAPIQVDMTVTAGTACTSVNAIRLNPSQAAGQQVFVCQDNGSTKIWGSLNDEAALQAQVNTLQSNSGTQQSALSAETAARIAGDNKL